MPGAGYRSKALSRYHSTHYGLTSANTEEQREERDRYFRLLIGRFLPKDRGARIIDVGCGTGRLLRFLQSEGYACCEGVDISHEQIQQCHAAGIYNVRKANATEFLSEVPGQYDCIIALDFIEHLTKQEGLEFLEASKSALRSGGVIILRTPNLGNILATKTLFSDITHETGYTEISIRQLLLLVGFERIEVVSTDVSSKLRLRLRYRLNELAHRILYRLACVPKVKVFSKNLLAVARKPLEA